MKKNLCKLLGLVLALALCLGLAAPAWAAPEAEPAPPDWYFLFAIFKNVDADIQDRNGAAAHAAYAMNQDEVDTIKAQARSFEEYMTQTGVMRAHVDVVEIDEVLTEFRNPDKQSSYIGAAQAAPFLEEKIDLDRYDHVACIFSTDAWNGGYLGISSSGFENGTGICCIHLGAWLRQRVRTGEPPEGLYTHEYLHFMERMCAKWGGYFELHGVEEQFYGSDLVAWQDDLIRNRAKGNAGTGVMPIAWQYPPHALRTMTQLTVPAGVAGIGKNAFKDSAALSRVQIHSGVTSIGVGAFAKCGALTEVTISSGLTGIEEWAFADCPALARISIPASVTSIGGAAFQGAGLTDVYYGGTEAQWKAVSIGGYNGPLNRAKIHCGRLMADVKTTDWFAQPVAWALEKGIAFGAGNGNFSPNQNCTRAQILTFLWRAMGCPEPAGKHPFPDVAGGDYYAGAAAWAYEKGLVSGSVFGGNTPCARSDAVTYLWKLAGSPAASGGRFADVPAGAAYAQAVSWAVEQGVASGTGNAAFSPTQTCTRGQIVTFLYRDLAE